MLKRLTSLLISILIVLPLALMSNPVSASTSVSITSPSSGSTATGTSFTVTGTATAKRAISVAVNGTTVGTTISDNSGNWSLNVTGQSAGAKTITATASVSYAYTFSNTASTISVINTVTDEKIGADVSSTVVQNQGVVSPDGTKMVTSPGFGNGTSIKVWNMSNPELPTVTSTITGADANILAVSYTPDGTYFYVTSEAGDFSGGHVTRYLTSDPTTPAAVIGFNQNFPAFISFKSDSSRLYVGNVISGTVSVINVATNTQVGTPFAVGGSGGPISPDNVHGYSINSSTGEAIPFNISSETAGSAITIGNSPRGGNFNQSGSQLIVNNFGSDNFSVIDTASNTVSNTISTGAGSAPTTNVFANDFSKLYVTNSGLDHVSVRNPSTFAETKTITVGDAPFGITIGPDQTATTSISFTLAAASSGGLAGTGSNTYLYYALVGILVTSSTFYFKKRYSNR